MIGFLAAGFGTATAAALLLFGICANIASKGFAFRAFPSALRQAFRPADQTKTVSPLQAFATSLAGTLGVGNLTGVSLAVALGGAGAVVWMWISALLCMIIKYFEIRLALLHQPKNESVYAFAPMEYIRKATGSKFFAAAFAAAGTASALIMGNLLQTGAAAAALQTSFRIPTGVTAAVFAAGTGAVVFGGAKRIARTAEKALPALGIGFLLLGGVLLLLRARDLPEVFADIFRSAFSLRAAGGGFLGAGWIRALRYGVGNGLFSHEAGLGSAGLAHGACGADPDRQGLWGILEVFTDTILLSTVSALVILVTGVDGSDGNGVTAAAQEVFGAVGGGAVSVCLALFAFLSVLSWGAYGETCFCWLAEKSGSVPFRILFSLTPLLAVLSSPANLLPVAEIANGVMLSFHLPGLIAFRKDLRRLPRLPIR